MLSNQLISMTDIVRLKSTAWYVIPKLLVYNLAGGNINKQPQKRNSLGRSPVEPASIVRGDSGVICRKTLSHQSALLTNSGQVVGDCGN